MVKEFSEEMALNIQGNEELVQKKKDVHMYRPVFVHECVCQCVPVSLCECRPQSPIPPLDL